MNKKKMISAGGVMLDFNQIPSLLIPGKVVVAVDFDDTMTAGAKFPQTGTIRKELVDILTKHRQYIILILWTCRSGNWLREAVSLSSDNGLIFDAINENAPQVLEKLILTKSQKIYYDVLIDDRNLLGLQPIDVIDSWLQACIQKAKDALVSN